MIFLTEVVVDDIIITLQGDAIGKVFIEFAQGKWYRVNLYNGADLYAVPFRLEVIV